MKISSYQQKLLDKAKTLNKTIVLPEGEDERILQAAHVVSDLNVAKFIILGNVDEMKDYFNKNNYSLNGIELVDPAKSSKLDDYTKLLYELRKEKGLTMEEASKLVLDNNYFGVLMVKAGDADGMVSGANHSTADTVRPALQIIKSARRDRAVSAFFIMASDEKEYIYADAGLNVDPTDKELGDIAVESALSALRFGFEPKVAMLSFSTKGSGKGESVDKVVNATKMAKAILATDEYKNLDIKLDGELQSDAAIDETVAKKKAPGSQVAGKANVLIFPDLDAGNIAYKLTQRLAGYEAYGPLLQGLNAPINDLSRGSLVEDIIGVIAVTAIQAG